MLERTEPFGFDEESFAAREDYASQRQAYNKVISTIYHALKEYVQRKYRE